MTPELVESTSRKKKLDGRLETHIVILSQQQTYLNNILHVAQVCGSKETLHRQKILENWNYQSYDSPSTHDVSLLVSCWKPNAVFFFFYYLPASQTIISSRPQSISPSPTESASFRPSISSQSNNISVGVSLTPSGDPSLTTKALAITELSNQGGLLASSFSSYETQNASLLISELITLPALVTGITLKGQPWI